MAFNEQISKVMPHENFSINLRIVCDEQISVAHVCRKMEINRQQFNKYLSGQIYPSKFNLNIFSSSSLPIFKPCTISSN